MSLESSRSTPCKLGVVIVECVVMLGLEIRGVPVVTKTYMTHFRGY